MKLFSTIIFINFFFINNAYAYIDPGSGSIILQALLGALAAAGATVSIYWNKTYEPKYLKFDNDLIL